MSRIEQIINEIEEYIDGCRYQPLSNTKIVVNKEEMEELLVELRLRVPDEIKKYQQIINQQDAILNDARSQAQNMIADARIQIDQLVNEHEIKRIAMEQAREIIAQAREQAQSIVDAASEEANGVRYSAIAYTDDLLMRIQDGMYHTLGSARDSFENAMGSLQNLYSECEQNRAELSRTRQSVDVHPVYSQVPVQDAGGYPHPEDNQNNQSTAEN